MDTGQTYRDFVSSVNNKDILKAEGELDENEESRGKGLSKLKELIGDEPVLLSRTDDEFLLRFLRARKFKVNLAFQLLKNYYRFRSKNQDIYGKLCPQDVDHVFNLNLVSPLAKRLDGSVVLVLRVGAAHPDIVSAYDGFRSAVLCLEKLVENEVTQINGVTFILDLKGFQLAHMKILLTPSLIFKVSSLIQESFPMRLKEVHILNNPAIFDIVFRVFKPFLKEKLKERFLFHRDNFETLHSRLSPSILPEECGGDLGPMDSSSWHKELLEWQPSFQLFLKNNGYDVRRKSDASSS